MSNVIKAELYRIKFTKKYIFAIIWGIVTTGLYLIPTKTSTDFYADIPLVLKNSLSAFMIFIYFAVAAIVCKEYQTNTIKNTITSGNGKTNIFFGKLAACIIGVLIMFAIQFVINVIPALFIGFGDTTVVVALGNLLLGLLSVVLFTAFMFSVATIFKTSGITIIIGLAVYIAIPMFLPIIDLNGAEKAISGIISVDSFAIGKEYLLPSVIFWCGLSAVLSIIAYSMFKKRSF